MAQSNQSPSKTDKFQSPVESGDEHRGTFESGKRNETLNVGENPPLRGSDHSDAQFSLSDEQVLSETSHKPHEELNPEYANGRDLVGMHVGRSSEQETPLEPNGILDPVQNQGGDLTDNTQGGLYNGEQVTSEVRHETNEALNPDRYEQVNRCVCQETTPGNRSLAVYVRFSDQLTVKPHMLPRHSKFVASRPTVDRSRHGTCSQK